MREEVSLLLETVRRWLELGPDVLLLYAGGSAPAARIPLERRVLGLVEALRQSAARGERRQLEAAHGVSSRTTAFRRQHWKRADR